MNNKKLAAWFAAEIADATSDTEVDAAIDRAIHAVSRAFTPEQIERALAKTALSSADRVAIRKAFAVLP